MQFNTASVAVKHGPSITKSFSLYRSSRACLTRFTKGSTCEQLVPGRGLCVGIAACRSDRINLTNNPQLFAAREKCMPLLHHRFKSNARKNKSAADSDIDKDGIEDELEEEKLSQLVDDEDDLLPGQKKDWQSVILMLHSSRIDAVLKEVLKLSRSKIEEAFYDNRIRRNGERLDKKAVDLEEGDEVDYILGNVEGNPDHLQVTRIQIRKFGDTVTPQGKSQVFVRIWKRMVIPNYDGKNKFTGGSESQSAAPATTIRKAVR